MANDENTRFTDINAFRNKKEETRKEEDEKKAKDAETLLMQKLGDRKGSNETMVAQAYQDHPKEVRACLCVFLEYFENVSFENDAEFITHFLQCLIGHIFGLYKGVLNYHTEMIDALIKDLENLESIDQKYEIIETMKSFRPKST